MLRNASEKGEKSRREKSEKLLSSDTPKALKYQGFLESDFQNGVTLSSQGM